MDVLAKHKVAGSTPVPRLHELGLRRGGRLVKDEERRWGSEDPFPAKWRLASPGAHEGGVSASRTWQSASKIGGDASRVGAPGLGDRGPRGRRRASELDQPTRTMQGRLRQPSDRAGDAARPASPPVLGHRAGRSSGAVGNTLATSPRNPRLARGFRRPPIYMIERCAWTLSPR